MQSKCNNINNVDYYITKLNNVGDNNVLGLKFNMYILGMVQKRSSPVSFNIKANS